MKLNEKLEYAKQSVRSIARHDDAPAGDVSHTLKALGVFMAEEERAARIRRGLPEEQGWLTHLWRKLRGS